MPVSRNAATLLAAAALAACLSAGDAAAHGPTPQKVEEAIEVGAPCELVWSTLLDFGAIAKWYPGLAKVEAEGASERGATRVITLENGETFTERLDEVDRVGQALTYRLAKENLKALPVSFYTARMAVTREGPQGKSCKVEWSGRLYRGDTTNEPPPELSDEAAVTAMSSFFRTGLEGLKKAVE
nr:SRPBCC family protein [Methylobrevis pamukkalensis]